MGKWLIAIMAVGIAMAVITELVQRRRERKRQEAAELELKQANERYAMDAAKREAAWQEKLFARRVRESKMPAKYPSSAPNARATVLKMRKDEFGKGGAQSQSEIVADALILQSMLYTPSGYLDGGDHSQFAIGKGGASDDSARLQSSSDSSSSPSDSGSGGGSN